VLLVVILVVVIALVFDYINGFHDTANAIATVVSTGVLPIRTAILIAAVLNFGGALMGTAVASTIGKGLIEPSAVSQIVVLSALVGAIFWNLFTWYFGIPSSSSHALVGGLVGAAVAHAGPKAVQVKGVEKVVKSLVVSPLVGFWVAFVVMITILWIVRRARPAKLTRIFRKLQMLSAGFMAFSHGSNDAQKTMGIITMSLVAYGSVKVGADGKFPVPLWVVLACAAAMAAGTAAGGIRIIKTMGTKIIDLKPIHGFAAETAAAATILTSTHLGLPVSTTHVITGCIMGAGASQRVSAVRWGVTTKILWAWVLTIPISATVAWACHNVAARIFSP
jgi:PiT family inorganic phosphate transporter